MITFITILLMVSIYILISMKIENSKAKQKVSKRKNSTKR